MSKTMGELLGSPSQSPATLIAISGSNKSKKLVKWALKKFGSERNVAFKILHIHPKVTSLPTPKGKPVSISEVPDDVAKTYRHQVMEEMKVTLHPFRKMCEHKKVAVDILVRESNHVAAAIMKEVNLRLINRLVIGRSSHRALSRKYDVTAAITASVPEFCTVYVVSKGVYIVSKDKLSSCRGSDSEGNAATRDDDSDRTDYSSCSSGSGPKTDVMSSALKSNSHAVSLPVRRLQQLPTIVRGISIPRETSSGGSDETRSISSDAEEINKRSSPDISRTVPWNHQLRDYDMRKYTMNMENDTHLRISQPASSISDTLSEDSFTDNQILDAEIRKLRAELRHAQDMYALAQVETMEASRKLIEFNKHNLEENEMEKEKLKLKEREAKELAEREEQQFEEARRVVKREIAKREAALKRESKRRAAHDAKEKHEVSPVTPKLQYQEFTWEEIIAATSSFSEDLKIGMGAYGNVYKCNLHHTIAAVKVLHSAENSQPKQFQQEIEVLSKIRHPHLLLLIGACPEQGALVYEYMENGSLDDRLFKVDKSNPPLPWFERFRIAWEVASALVFLHKSKPKPIIHRDLKPGNILLDHNFVSKVGDVGLSTMIQADTLLTQFTMYKQTSPVGTLCYIDPEYQRTGKISPKSDVYAFGMIILQLLTAQPAMGLTDTVETAMDNKDEFLQILDKKAGNWPVEETRQLTSLALYCTELRSKDRPDLNDEVLPVLEGLKKVADKARTLLNNAPSQPPSHFLCPLRKEVMKDPCVAADGYTYDRRAIEEWMEEHYTSPLTGLPLGNITLLPNHTLNAAITEWSSGPHKSKGRS